MRDLRSSFWMKALSVLLILSSGFLSAYFGLLGVLELVCYGVNDWDAQVSYFYDNEDPYRDRALASYLLSQSAGQLTYLGSQRKDELSKQLDPASTNFRYRVLDMDGNTLQTNVPEEQEWAAVVDPAALNTRTYTVGDLCTFRVVSDSFSSSPTYYKMESTSSTVSFLHSYSAFYPQLYAMVEHLEEFDTLSDTGSYAIQNLSLIPQSNSASFFRSLSLLLLLRDQYYPLGYDRFRLDLSASEHSYAGWSVPAMLFEDLFRLVYYRSHSNAGSPLADIHLLTWSELDAEQSLIAKQLSLGPKQGLVKATFDGAAHYLPCSQDYLRLLDNNLADFANTECYILEWGVDRKLPVNDALHLTQLRMEFWKDSFKKDCTVAGLAAFVLLLSLVWLLYAAGHTEGEDGIHVSALSQFPQDLVLGAAAFLLSLLANWVRLRFIDSVSLYDIIGQTSTDRNLLCAGAGLLTSGALVLILPLFVGTTVQLKARCFWRSTLLFRVGRWVVRGLRWAGIQLGYFFRALPNAVQTAILYLLGWIAAFGAHELLALGQHWVIVPLVAAFVAGIGLCVRRAGNWNTLREAGKALAEGDLSHQTDVRGMPPDLQEHAEHLNALSRIVEDAVEQQTRSDRFRTELITNVSHDLKTPLTSIINYVDLLKKRELQDEEAQKYLAILDAKSQRLKTLTEDLVEASKASAGVLPVTLERLEAGALLQQAVGEYQDRLAAHALEVRINKPDTPVWINADGRHTWRILENLLSNCAKYAMPNTRVYASVAEDADGVVISIKNVSAQPLNVPAEELMERFVRGERSRTSEGSGLGLSITQSLAELQGAVFALEIDGDLFKATLRFPRLEATEEL